MQHREDHHGVVLNDEKHSVWEPAKLRPSNRRMKGLIPEWAVSDAIEG
jgi:hypothetical protein